MEVFCPKSKDDMTEVEQFPIMSNFVKRDEKVGLNESM